MNAARKLAEALRGVLPTSREAGRVRKKGEEPADVQALQAMKVCLLLDKLTQQGNMCTISNLMASLLIVDM